MAIFSGVHSRFAAANISKCERTGLGRLLPFSELSDSYSLNDRIRSVTYRSTSSEILIVDDVGNGENRPERDIPTCCGKVSDAA